LRLIALSEIGREENYAPRLILESPSFRGESRILRRGIVTAPSPRLRATRHASSAGGAKHLLQLRASCFVLISDAYRNPDCRMVSVGEMARPRSRFALIQMMGALQKRR
jgi:hypothetical protein